MRFAEGLGTTREEVQAAELLPATSDSVKSLQSLTQRDDYREGLAALLAYESQIPQVAQTKREGLRAFYGIDDERAVAFFRVHESIDVLHQQTEMQILTDSCQSAADQQKAIASARDGAKALWNFLDGVTAAYLPRDLSAAPA